MSTELTAYADDFAAIFCATARQTLKVALGRTCQIQPGERLPGLPASSELSLEMTLTDGGTGRLVLLLDRPTAAVLCDLMMMGDGNSPWTDEHKDALQELGNQLAGSISTGQTERWGSRMSFAAHVGAGETPAEASCYPVVVELQGLPTREMVLCVERKLQQTFMRLDEERSSRSEFPRGDDFQEGVGHDAEPAAHRAAPASRETPAPQSAPQTVMIDSRDPPVQRLLDVPIDIQIELGQTELSIRRILEIGPGSIIELDRMAGEPVDLVVNDKVIARGEVVVIEENFGIRVTQLVGPEDRGRVVR
jgi:flagellar motor switch protein FliN/FliY